MRAPGRVGIGGAALAVTLAALQPGCVVHVEPPPEAPADAALPPPADFTEVQQRIEVLLDEAREVDRIDRLQAAHDLARHMRSADPHAQRVVLEYLRAIVAIEERSRPMEAPRLVMGEADGAPLFAPPVVEEDLGGEEPVAAGPPPGPAAGEGPASPSTGERAAEEGPASPSTGERAAEEGPASPSTGEPGAGGASLDVAERVARAEELIADGRPGEAMALLGACRDRPCWEEVADEWVVARDAVVHARRQDAVRRFLAARDLADPAARRAAWEAVRDELRGLLDRWPDTTYADEIRRNLEVVEQAIAGLDAAGPAAGEAAGPDATGAPADGG